MSQPPAGLKMLGKAFLIIFGHKVDDRHSWRDFTALLGKKN